MDRCLLEAMLVSLFLHGLLLTVPGDPFSVMHENTRQPDKFAGRADEKLQVFLREVVESQPELRPVLDEEYKSTIVSANDADNRGALKEELPYAIGVPPEISQPSAEYLLANDLDVHPSPQSPINVPFPDSIQGRVKGRVILDLFVSADGVVQQASITDSDLPPAFGQVARQTFAAARLLPGMKDGRPVAARMRILVEFENY